MAPSEKYGRTSHYPFSPGATSDDRVNFDYWNDLQQIDELVHTEKLDGENNCLTKRGVFARSHAAPTTSPWTTEIRRHWQQVKNDLGELEIFGENCYAIHSLQYTQMHSHFYVFAVRLHDQWLSWEETKFYAGLLDLPVVPEIAVIQRPLNQAEFERSVLQIVSGPGAFAPVDIITGQPATMEGLVTRNTATYPAAAFKHCVFKYVRKDHVKTNTHWTRNWKRAPLANRG